MAKLSDFTKRRKVSGVVALMLSISVLISIVKINSYLKDKYTSEVFECLKVSESDLIRFGIDQSDANKYLGT